MTLYCSNCKKTFSRKDSGLKTSLSGNVFCSKSCSATFNNFIPKRKRTNKCFVCQTPILSDRKYCSRECSYKVKPLKDFSPETIRIDNRKRIINHRRTIKLKAIEYKGGKCEKCGYNRCIQALSFHHLDPKEKDFSISSCTKGWESIKKELDKCIMVCSNCHAEQHYGVMS